MRNAPDGRASSLIALISNQSERTAVIAVEAASYRDDSVAPYVAESARTPLAPEDIWAPQLHSLACDAMLVARERMLYIALDANELTPRQPQLVELLMSVVGCGVMGATDEASAETIVNNRLVQWDRWIAEGHVGLTLRDVDGLPDIVDSQKPFLRVQLLHKAGLYVEALAAIRTDLLASGEIDPTTRVRLARIADEAGASNLAQQLLEDCINELDSREDLEIVSVLWYRRVSMRLQNMLPIDSKCVFPARKEC